MNSIEDFSTATCRIDELCNFLVAVDGNTGNMRGTGGNLGFQIDSVPM